MADQYISSLDALNPNSLFQISSLAFWGSNAGSSRLIPAPILQTVLGMPLNTAITNSDILSYSTNVRTFIHFDQAIEDPMGLFDSNSAGKLWINWTGWVRAKYGIETDNGGNSDFHISVRKNNSIFPGCGWAEERSSINPFWVQYTAPFTVTSGDVISLVYWENGQHNFRAGTYLALEPISIQVPIP